MSSAIDFAYIHDQDMNYYKSEYNYDGLGSNNGSVPDSVSDTNTFDGDPGEESSSDLDAEFSALLDDLEDDLHYAVAKRIKDDCSDDDQKCDDFSYDFSDKHDEDDVDKLDDKCDVKVPSWYYDLLQTKVQESKSRLFDLSFTASMVCPSGEKVIASNDYDHYAPFCKMDHPRHPSLDKPWKNYWKFNCVTKCKEDPTCVTHRHNSDCEVVILKHVGTSITTKSNNIFECEFPNFVMLITEIFQKFLNASSNERSLQLLIGGSTCSASEKPFCTYIKIRSNYENKVQLTICGRIVKPILNYLKTFFFDGVGKTCNVVSLYYVEVKPGQKIPKALPKLLRGNEELEDKIGPITINYTPRTSINFNSIKAFQLSLVMTDFLAPTRDTTVIDIGCNIGILSLIMSDKCDKVIGLNTLRHEIEAAEQVKLENGIRNVTFITCAEEEVQTKCTPLVNKCMTVAMLSLASPFAKSQHVYKALRELPTVWRVVVYGTFTKEFHQLITTLITKDFSMGDEFLPSRGCIIDKSPSLPNAFDIVVLFERKPIIQSTTTFHSIDEPMINNNLVHSNNNESKLTTIKEENVCTKKKLKAKSKLKLLPVKVKLPEEKCFDIQPSEIKREKPFKTPSKIKIKLKLKSPTLLLSRPMVEKKNCFKAPNELAKEENSFSSKQKIKLKSPTLLLKRSALEEKNCFEEPLPSQQVIKKEESFGSPDKPIIRLKPPTLLLNRLALEESNSSETTLSSEAAIKKTWHHCEEMTEDRETDQSIEMAIARIKIEPSSPKEEGELDDPSPINVKQNALASLRNEPVKIVESEPIMSPDTFENLKTPVKMPSSPLPDETLRVRFKRRAKPVRRCLFGANDDDDDEDDTEKGAQSYFVRSPRNRKRSSWNYRHALPDSPPPRRYRSRSPNYRERSPSSPKYVRYDYNGYRYGESSSHYSRNSSKYVLYKWYHSPSPSPTRYRGHSDRRSISPTIRRRRKSSPLTKLPRSYRSRSKWDMPVSPSPSPSPSPPPLKKHKDSSRDSTRCKKEKKRSRKRSSSDWDKKKEKKKDRREKIRKSETRKEPKKNVRSETRFDVWDIPSLSTLTDESLSSSSSASD